MAELARPPARLNGFRDAHRLDGLWASFKAFAAAAGVVAMRHWARADINGLFPLSHDAVYAALLAAGIGAWGKKKHKQNKNKFVQICTFSD